MNIPDHMTKSLKLIFRVKILFLDFFMRMRIRIRNPGNFLTLDPGCFIPDLQHCWKVIEILSVARPRIVYSAESMFLPSIMTGSQCFWLHPVSGLTRSLGFDDTMRHFFSPGIRNLIRLACGYIFWVSLKVHKREKFFVSDFEFFIIL